MIIAEEFIWVGEKVGFRRYFFREEIWMCMGGGCFFEREGGGRGFGLMTRWVISGWK